MSKLHQYICFTYIPMNFLRSKANNDLFCKHIKMAKFHKWSLNYDNFDTLIIILSKTIFGFLKVKKSIKVEWLKWETILKLSDQSDIFESIIIKLSKL